MICVFYIKLLGFWLVNLVANTLDIHPKHSPEDLVSWHSLTSLFHADMSRATVTTPFSQCWVQYSHSNLICLRDFSWLIDWWLRLINRHQFTHYYMYIYNILIGQWLTLQDLHFQSQTRFFVRKCCSKTRAILWTMNMIASNASLLLKMARLPLRHRKLHHRAHGRTGWS